MNAEFKKQWLAELRDTECPWKQGTGVLMGPQDEACCLGVATDIAIREGVIAPWSNGEGSKRWYAGGDSYALPDAVVKWAGLPQANPLVKWTALNGTSLTVNISLLNDGGCVSLDGIEYVIPRHTFAQIADVIEAQL